MSPIVDGIWVCRFNGGPWHGRMVALHESKDPPDLVFAWDCDGYDCEGHLAPGDELDQIPAEYLRRISAYRLDGYDAIEQTATYAMGEIRRSSRNSNTLQPRR